MLLGIVGKPNAGKSTFLKAATLKEVEIASYPFTTIKPNQAVAYVTSKCPCRKLGVECNPQNSKCVGGVRMVPVKLIDVAGLVPDAHKGRGKGIEFLNDLSQASALIHVVDISGSSDSEGNMKEPGSSDPAEDVRFLPREIDQWILGIVKKGFEQIKRKAQAGEKLEEMVHNQLTGFGVSLEDVREVIGNLDKDSGEKDLLEFVKRVREKSKPIIISANKVDIDSGRDNLEKVISEFPEYRIIPCSAESELALRKAEESGIVRYDGKGFEIFGGSDSQKRALEFIRENVLDRFGSTGIQECLNTAVFELLEMAVVYPVASINKLADKKGNVLPDAFLVKSGTTLKDFAGQVHSDMAKDFIGGVGLNRKKVGADYELRSGDVVEILFRR